MQEDDACVNLLCYEYNKIKLSFYAWLNGYFTLP